MDIVPFGGWSRNARLTCNDSELIVTLEVGPRIISYGPRGGPNLFLVDPTTAGQTGGEEFKSYGGHRLWIAPEEAKRTFRPDNEPVESSELDGYHIFTSPVDEFHTQKQMLIKPEPENDRFVVVHRIYNHSPYHLEMAAWAPTQCKTGTILFPQPEFIAHASRVLPARPLVMWHYTDLSDPRWTWGPKVARLRHDPAMNPQKIGAAIDQGYAALFQEGVVFLKRFDFDPDATYPDFGCNFEAFTRQDMIEIETLGPMEFVAPDDFTEHVEAWYLIPGVALPDDEDECADWLARLADERPY